MSEESEEFPSGTIIRRLIRGKERFYHQWRENGQTKSRYLKPDEILPLREKIEKRKARLKANATPAAEKARASFACGVLTGSRLAELASSVRPFRSRPMLDDITAFLKGPEPRSLLVLEGLPQTGKTTLLRQVLAALDESALAACAYLSLPADLTARDFLADLRQLVDQGRTRLLVDGFTRAPALREIAPVLEDAFSAAGIRLVLAADAPHEFVFPPRTQIVSTTFLSYRDFARIGARASVEDYLRTGGPVESQVDARSLRTIKGLLNRSLLRILTDAAHRRTTGSTRLASDLQKLGRRLGERLGDEPSREELARLARFGIVAAAEDEFLLLLPGLRHALSRQAVRELLADDIAAHLGAAERKIVEATVLDRVADRTLADLVLYRMMCARKNATTEVFRVHFPTGGFDVVVADREELTCELFEVRDATERNDLQLANLLDAEMLDTVEHRYGTIVARTLVYKGRNAWHTSGVAYRKAEDYL